MNCKEAFGWLVAMVSVGLRLSQAKTLSQLALAAAQVSRISLAEIGRQLTYTTAKHGIKRVDRFVGNRRVVVSDAMQGVIAKLVGRLGERALVVALDWTEFRQFHTLSLVAVAEGRGVPLLWATYEEWELYKSQNNLEEGLLRLFRTLVPEEVFVILLADRGFGRTELARTCQELRFHYVIRISPDVWIEAKAFGGKLLDFPVKKGICRMLKHVQYRKENPLEQHVVVCWKRGLPKDRDECWFLMTDLDWSARTLVSLYGRRMTIEQVFRDQKNRRNGWSLRDVQVRSIERFDRLLLVLALAYLLLMGLGYYARRYYCPSTWSTTSRPGQSSAFGIGRAVWHRLRASPEQVFSALIAVLKEASKKWG